MKGMEQIRFENEVRFQRKQTPLTTHVADQAALDRGKRLGGKTKCGLPLEEVAFYWQVPYNDKQRAEICDVCLG